MALKFIDGFDHYTDAFVAKMWNQGKFSTANGVVAAGVGRNGTAGWTRAWRDGLAHNFGGTEDTVIFGGAFKLNTLATTAGIEIIWWMGEGTGRVHTELIWNESTGKLFVRRAGTAITGDGTAVLVAGVWYYLEMKVTISDTGSVVVKVNGITDISASPVDTRNAATGYCDTIVLGGQGGSAGGDIVMDDIYVCDDTGGTNNDFLGDIRVEHLLPNGNGNSSQFDGSDGNTTDNYLLVDDATPNDDTDYVESPDSGDKDTYAYGNLASSTGSVYGVQICPYARKTESGIRNLKTVARLSGTETDGPERPVGDSYAYLPDIRETKPGGGAWSISDVNSAEFGQKVV